MAAGVLNQVLDSAAWAEHLLPQHGKRLGIYFDELPYADRLLD